MQITTKRRLEELNGEARPNIIARTGGHIVYMPARPAFALLDFDTKGMPEPVADQLQELGGYWPALVSVLPELARVARVVRRSTSAGLFRSDTEERLPGSNGLHVYLAVRNGADIERFLNTLHKRCWLAGLGWMTLGSGGHPNLAHVYRRKVERL